MTTKHEKLQPVSQLSPSYTDALPLDADWSTGYPEQWDYVVAGECEDCGKTMTGSYYMNCQECDRDHEEMSEGPMMNYLYPLDDVRADWAAEQIRDLPLCIITAGDCSNEVEGMALTGGGMDLSWEICEAYMRLGYLPPARFCDLPRMAGKNLTSNLNAWIIAGCLESVRVETEAKVSNLNYTRRKLQDLLGSETA